LHILQENALLCITSSEKSETIVKDCWINDSVCEAVNNCKEEIHDKSFCCFSFSD